MNTTQFSQDLLIKIEAASDVLESVDEVLKALRTARKEMSEDDWNKRIEDTPLEAVLDCVADLEWEVEKSIENS